MAEPKQPMSRRVQCEEIPMATPYPWEQDELNSLLVPLGKKQPDVGSGFSALYGRMNGTMKPRCKAILQNLLQEQRKSVDAGDVVLKTNGSDLLRPHNVECAASEMIPASGINDSELLSRAQNGQVSLFLHILQTVQDLSPSTGITTKQILRTCSLGVFPGSVPPHMDCKEFTMASLFFLSSQTNDNDDEHVASKQIGKIGGKPAKEVFPELPLIVSVNEERDLEKRSFRKQGDWALSDKSFCQKVLALETVFLQSSSNWEHLGRMRHCPRLDDEVALLMKGTLPQKSRKAASEAASSNKKRKLAASPKPREALQASESPMGTDSEFAAGVTEAPSEAPATFFPAS